MNETLLKAALISTRKQKDYLIINFLQEMTAGKNPRQFKKKGNKNKKA